MAEDWFISYNWIAKQPGDTHVTQDNTGLHVNKGSEQGLVKVLLPLEMAAQWKAFFHTAPESDIERILSDLRNDIKHNSLSSNEAQLLILGSETKGVRCDSSLWLWLCRFFAVQNNFRLPQLSFDKNHGLMSLSLTLQGAGFFLALPKNRTWELLSSLRECGLDVTILPTAQECFRVKSLPSGAIQVSPSLLFSDGKLRASHELESQKMGSHYFFPGKGFLPVTKLAKNGIITQLNGGEQISLFDFAKDSKAPHRSFKIEPDCIQDFLKRNKKALQHPANQVDQDILDISINLLPQELVIDTFREDTDWCYLSCHYGMGDATISLEDILDAGKSNSNYIPGKVWLQLSDSPLSWLHDLLPERLHPGKNGESPTLRLRHGEFMAFTRLIPEVRHSLCPTNTFHKRLSALLDSDSWTNDSLLQEIPTHLRSYQRTGLAWLSNLYRFGLGGLLADDMGLGKTHQGLALLHSIQKQQKDSIQLILCPASVLFHWKNKIEQFYPQLRYSLFYGPDRTLDLTQNPGLLISTYTVARIDQDLLAQIPFDIILLDEIQNLKNHKTGAHKAVALFNAKVKIGLTGTPIENSLTDLHALFTLCLPGFFGDSKNFATNFLHPIKNNKNKDVEKRLRSLIHPFILRRNRKQVLTELPALSIDDRTCELSNTQVKLYREVVDESQDLLADMESIDKSTQYINILAMLTRLKQICNHPSLLEKSIDAEQYESGKWNLFLELISECLAADRKIVVFSQYTGMLDIIEHYLKQAGIGHASLHGKMSINKREKMLARFRDEKECRIFCASLLAGGTGIDLISAQVVIHYDRWWNPAKESQATARVHRMGQKEQVQVFRLITIGTLEEKIHHLLKRKQEISDALISTDEEGVIKKLDPQQLKELFRLD